MRLSINERITASLSLVALFISIMTYLDARHDSNIERIATVERYLDNAWESLYGTEGYTSKHSQKSLTDAEVSIEHARLLIPDRPRVVEYQGHLLEIHGDKVGAKKLYLRSLGLDRSRARPYNLLGSLSEGSEAITYLQKAIALDDKGAWRYHLRLGQLYLKERNLNNAEQSLIKCLAVNTKCAQAHYELARVYQSKEQFEKSRSNCEKAVALEPRSVTFMVQLGQVIMAMRKDEEGIFWIRRAQKIDPLDDHPLSMLAAIYADRGDAKTALSYAAEAKRLNPLLGFNGEVIADLESEMTKKLQSSGGTSSTNEATSSEK